MNSGIPAAHWNMAELPGLDRMGAEEIRKVIRDRATGFLQQAKKEGDSSSAGYVLDLVCVVVL